MAQTGVYRNSFPEEVAPVLSVRGGAGVGTNQAKEYGLRPYKEYGLRKRTKARNSKGTKTSNSSMALKFNVAPTVVGSGEG